MKNYRKFLLRCKTWVVVEKSYNGTWWAQYSRLEQWDGAAVRGRIPSPSRRKLFKELRIVLASPTVKKVRERIRSARL